MKKIISILSILFTVSVLFAEPKSTGLTDSDVSNFVKNYTEICQSMEAVTSESKADSILSKYGISGPGRMEKYQTLAYGTAAVVAEQEIDAESAALLKSLGMDPLAQFTSNINSKDFALIKKYSKQLVAASNKFENSSSNKDDDYYDNYAENHQKELLAQRDALLNQYFEEEANKKRNEVGEGSIYVQSAKKKITSAKKTGDCGLLYKKYDAKNAAKYSKTAVPDASFVAYKTWETENGHTDAQISVLNKRINFRYYTDPLSDQSEDFLELTVTSTEFYMLKSDSKTKYWNDGASGEYVIKTKEAGTIHVWYTHPVNNSKPQTVKVWIEGLGELDFGELVYVAG